MLVGRWTSALCIDNLSHNSVSTTSCCRIFSRGTDHFADCWNSQQGHRIQRAIGSPAYKSYSPYPNIFFKLSQTSPPTTSDQACRIDNHHWNQHPAWTSGSESGKNRTSNEVHSNSLSRQSLPYSSQIPVYRNIYKHHSAQHNVNVNYPSPGYSKALRGNV